MTFKFVQVEAFSYAHHFNDPKKATAYEVYDGDILLGRVESHSEANMIKPRGLRYFTGQNGYSRWWKAVTPQGREVGYHHYRRQDAAKALQEEHRGR